MPTPSQQQSFSPGLSIFLPPPQNAQQCPPPPVDAHQSTDLEGLGRGRTGTAPGRSLFVGASRQRLLIYRDCRKGEREEGLKKKEKMDAK